MLEPRKEDQAGQLQDQVQREAFGPKQTTSFFPRSDTKLPSSSGALLLSCELPHTPATLNNVAKAPHIQTTLTTSPSNGG